MFKKEKFMKNNYTLFFTADPGEIRMYKDHHRDISSGIKIKKLGFDQNSIRYVGISYIGKMPSKKEIDTILKHNRVEFL